MRADGRTADQLRPLTFERGFARNASGSVLIRMGQTVVLCTCSIEASVPPFLEGSGKGWLTAEYAMLPGSTLSRKPRDRSGKIDGRSVEIQRLIGRALRAVVDLTQLGERTLWLDCDVVQADGGTRTASINGAFVALLDALAVLKNELPPMGQIVRGSVAAVSVGWIEESAWLDLAYVEDKEADIDLNLVMTGDGRFVEVQGAGEKATFTRSQLDMLLALGQRGIETITLAQRHAVGDDWPLD